MGLFRDKDIRLMLDIVPDATLLVDRGGCILDANALCEPMFGYDRNELIGQQVETLVPEASREAHARHCAGFFSKPRIINMGTAELELSGRRRDGTPFPADIKINPLETKSGLIAMVVVRDITERRLQESQLMQEKRRLEAVTDFTNCALFVLDKETRIVYANRVAETWFGPELTAPGNFCWRAFGLKDPKRECAGMEVTRTGKAVHREAQATLADGEEHFIFLDATPVKDENGDIEQIIEMVVDITDFKRKEDELIEANERFKAVFEASPLPVIAYDKAGIVKLWNRASEAVFGWREEEVIGRFLPAVSKEGVEQFSEIRDRLLLGEVVTGMEVRRCRKDRSQLYVNLSAAPLRDASGEITGIVAVLEDLTERKKAEAKIEYLAYHDHLTELPNRELLLDRLSQTLAFADRAGQTVAVIQLGLDKFKSINDAYGVEVGDRLLTEVARRLSNALRKGDTLARLSGDEFGVVLANIDRAEDAAKSAQSLLETVSGPFQLNNREIFVSAGVGISLFPADGREPAALIRNADTAMAYAKRQGRNNYRFFAAAFQKEVSGRLALENDLVGSQDRNELKVYYQPHVDLGSGLVTGAEALVRWEHPRRGLVFPDDFIHIAEETELIVPIGEYVLRTACAQARAWQDAHLEGLSVAVNLSGRQVRRGDLPQTVRRALKEAKLAPHRLILELTETALMEDVDEAARMLGELKRMGVNTSLDDFGTGYSSLAILKDLPFDMLKIDRSFIWDMIGNSDTADIVKAIISMAHALGLSVVAEGVETKEQLGFLRSLKSDAVQGYYFSAPVPAADFERYIRGQRRLRRRAA